MSRTAFNRLSLTELKLLVREPMLLFWGIGFPLVLTVVFGLAGHKPDKSLGGISLIDAYVPVMMAFVLTVLAISALPTTLANYREKGILRRLSSTPVRPVLLLGADVAVYSLVSVVALAVIVVVAKVAFHAQFPKEVLGFLVVLLLGGVAMLSLGTLIAAVSSTGRVAAALGTLLFFPMMFFAGLWVPRQQMGAGLRHVSDFTPLGAMTASVQQTMHGNWPSTEHVLVLLAYAVALAVAAIRLFRWE